MQIYIHRDNQQLGPFTEAEIKAQLASGAISLQDHVWWQGQEGWVPLGQSPLLAALSPTLPGSAPAVPVPLPGTPAVPLANSTVPETSKLAIWALVCGCLTLLCGILTAIPAIILGHMGLSEIKNHPNLKGRGMALAGLIIGYFVTALVIVAVIALMALGTQVTDIFKTMNAQLNAAQSTNNADQSATNSDQTTNTPDQTTPTPPATNSPDQSTNSAPAPTNSPDASTNAPASSTNAAPMNQ